MAIIDVRNSAPEECDITFYQFDDTDDVLYEYDGILYVADIDEGKQFPDDGRAICYIKDIDYVIEALGRIRK